MKTTITTDIPRNWCVYRSPLAYYESDNEQTSEPIFTGFKLLAQRFTLDEAETMVAYLNRPGRSCMVVSAGGEA
jgi:hypothetical protein